MRRAATRVLEGGVKVFNRSGWGASRLEWLPRRPQGFYGQDELYTYNAHPFLDDDRFQRAYSRAVQAGRHDYAIPWRVHTILWAAQIAERADGAFVECGTGRGFMASAICDYLGWGSRPFLLYDTFE